MKTYIMIIPICHYTIVENFYANVSFIPLRSESCLNYLLPKSRNSATVQRLRDPFHLVPDKPRTNRYKNSFVVYALNNYQ